MPEKEKMFENTGALRQRAEDKLKSRSLAMQEDIAALSPEDIRKTLHELNVHQIELRLVRPDGALIWAHLTATAAQADDTLKEIPVLFISALTEVADKVKAFSAGGVD